MNNVTHLGPHSRMTPEQCLAACGAEQWDMVVVVGFQPGRTSVDVRSSKMTREEALWVIEHAKLHAMGV